MSGEHAGVIEVRKNERGAWCVYIDGRMISDHRDHEAARIAALRHQGIDAPAHDEGQR